MQPLNLLLSSNLILSPSTNGLLTCNSTPLTRFVSTSLAAKPTAMLPKPPKAKTCVSEIPNTQNHGKMPLKMMTMRVTRWKVVAMSTNRSSLNFLGSLVALWYFSMRCPKLPGGEEDSSSASLRDGFMSARRYCIKDAQTLAQQSPLTKLAMRLHPRSVVTLPISGTSSVVPAGTRATRPSARRQSASNRRTVWTKGSASFSTAATFQRGALFCNNLISTASTRAATLGSSVKSTETVTSEQTMYAGAWRLLGTPKSCSIARVICWPPKIQPKESAKSNKALGTLRKKICRLQDCASLSPPGHV
mmetsp:Transcript_35672/g.82899  ORF Transcript_35672/g.82899 Transcript_35672/m.82899 type:complete len:304 (+) Transcript_35672:760-1671(+)